MEGHKTYTTKTFSSYCIFLYKDMIHVVERVPVYLESSLQGHSESDGDCDEVYYDDIGEETVTECRDDEPIDCCPY